MKTDQEIIEALTTAKPIDAFDADDWNRLIALAETGAGLTKQPPAGAVKVQLAVVYGDRDDVVSFPCDDWGALEPPSSALRAAWRCVDLPTHAAIVTAWIPPLPEPAAAEVEGTSDSHCPLCANSHADA